MDYNSQFKSDIQNYADSFNKNTKDVFNFDAYCCGKVILFELSKAEEKHETAIHFGMTPRMLLYLAKISLLNETGSTILQPPSLPEAKIYTNGNRTFILKRNDTAELTEFKAETDALTFRSPHCPRLFGYTFE